MANNEIAENNNFDWVFTYEHLLLSAYKCKNGVSWKSSVQNYMNNVHMNVSRTYDELHSGKFKYSSTYEFDTYERGKKRHIKSMHIRERVVQKCLCDYCLSPILNKSFIYDNGASLKGKGLTFTIDRLKKMLRKHYSKFGINGYVLLFDFSDYFGSISHSKAMELISKYITDTRLLSLIEQSIKIYADKTSSNNTDDYVGIGLGSQLSQIFALLIANPIDHMIKDKLGFKHYIRYMDDGIVICEDKEKLRKLLADINAKADELGLKLNTRKTKIVKLTHGFEFLKKRTYLCENGKIIMKISRQSITRMRRKLKKFKKLLDKNLITIDNIECSYKSWRGFASQFNNYFTIINMDALYKDLFGYIPKYTKTRR